MTSWLGKKSITARIAIVAAILSLGVVGFAAIDVFHRYSVVQNMNHAGQIVDLVPPTSNIIHELQKERGQSAGFISTNGRSFSATLPDSRSQTDSSLQVAKAALSSFPYSQFPETVFSSAQDALGNLDKLTNIRASVDQLQITTPEMASFYTETINQLIHLIAELRKADHEGDISRELMAHLSFLNGKENAGLERAMGAVGFGTGEFARPIYNNLIRFIEKQDAYFRTFYELSDDAHRQVYDELLSGPFIERVERLRNIALQSPDTGTTSGVTGSTWFEATTARINLMKKVEDRNIVLLRQAVQSKLSSAWNILVIESLITLVLLGVSIGFVFLVTRSISNDIGTLSKIMDRLSGGDLSVDVSSSGRKDEIGSITNAVVSFKNAAVEKRNLEDQAAKDERNKQLKQREAELERRHAKKNVEIAVENVGSALNALASGNLAASIDVKLTDEYDRLKQDFNSASAKLRDTLSVVLQNADDIMCGTREIAQASDDMSRRTENQAETLEQTASALDQITKRVTSSAENASKAQSIVNAAAEGAQRGGNVVDKAVEAMGAIEASSKEVSDITGVIDEIAFQTNLLALNAGVEAARAGESGKGFAVVATEVRELAQRSAQAAKQIKNLITNSNTQIESGVQLVRESGSNLKTLVEEIQNLNILVGDISDGAAAQAQGLTEINQSVSQLDQVTQQNAAMAEEATAATRTLANKSEHLAKLVGDFDLGSGSASAEISQSRVGSQAA